MNASMITNWRNGLITALDSSEQQVEGLGRRFDAVAKRFEKKTHLRIGQLKKQVGVGQHWLKGQISWLKDAEVKAETAVEASLVMMHFVQKDAKEMLETYKTRYAKAYAKLCSRHTRFRDSAERRSIDQNLDGLPIAGRQHH